MASRRSQPRLLAVPAIAGVVSAASLLFAYWVQTGLEIVPCELCLVERWPYRIALVLSIAALALPGRSRRGIKVVALSAIALVFAASAALAALHVGVEQQYWQSPFPECRAPRFVGGSFADQLASMPLHPAKPCDAATYLVPHLPLSMAALNLILSLCLLAYVARSLVRMRRWSRP
jgi:disulfide bond formation protein DsbB